MPANLTADGAKGALEACGYLQIWKFQSFPHYLDSAFPKRNDPGSQKE
jgi:hypothetical protein